MSTTGIKLVRKNPETYALDVRVQSAGRQYRKRETFLGCLRDATARYWKLHEELQGLSKTAGKRSLTVDFAHVLDYYLSRVSVDKGSLTYFTRLKRDLGAVFIDNLRERFEAYFDLLRRSRGEKTGRVLTNGTINRVVAWAKAALNYSVSAGVISKNPIEYIQKLPEEPRDRVLTEEECLRLLDAIKTHAPHIFPIVQYTMFVPCRIGELRKLKRTDYDKVNNVLIVRRNTVKGKRRDVFKPVPECLIEYARTVPVESETFFYRKERGRYLPIGNFRKAFRRCLRIAGIDDYRFHDQRHVSYTALLLAGNTSHAITQVAGHATDMSRVYGSRDGMLAAKSLTFGNRVEVLMGQSKVLNA